MRTCNLMGYTGGLIAEPATVAICQKIIVGVLAITFVFSKA